MVYVGMELVLHAATKDPSVKAIVLRINSPGGSAVASSMIHHSIQKVKKAGKKIVASIGDVAASGGYMIASGCDKIVASPGSITGSIGVIAGRVSIANLIQQSLHANYEETLVGKNANVYSILSPLSDTEKKSLGKLLDYNYKTFIEMVAAGRGLTVDHVSSIAEGRVFTGVDAKTIGLVDDFGGLDKAVQVAKDMIGDQSAEATVYKLSFREEMKELMKYNFRMQDQSVS
jgi:protease-4